MKVLLFLLLAWCLAPVSGPGQDLSVAERVQFADGLYARGMYEPAAREYESLLAGSDTPPTPDVLCYRLGECYRETGNRSEAEKAFRRVFIEYPQSPFRAKAGFRRARLFMEIAQYESAIALFSDVLQIRPPDDIAAACFYFTGLAQIEQGDSEAARAAFRTVVERYASSDYHSYATLELAHSLRDVERGVDEAVRLYEAVVKEAPLPRVAAEAWFQLGALHFKREAYRESAAAYKQLLTEYPADERSSEAMLQAAWASHNAGLYADALSLAEKMLARETAVARDEWLYLKANCERSLLRAVDAVRTYERLLKDVPDSPFRDAACYELALTHYRSGDFNDAVKVGVKLTAEPAFQKDIYWLLAESYTALKRTDEAIQYYGLITREFPGSDVAADATFRLAHHLRQKGRYEEAATYYGAVVDRYPTNALAPQALFAAAFCFSSAGREAEAVRDWNRLVSLFPDSHLAEEALYQKGVGEVRLDRDADALETLGVFLRRFRESKLAGDAHFWTGVLLKTGGDPVGAEHHLRQAIEQTVSVDVKNKAQFQLAGILQQTGRAGEAAVLFQDLIGSPLRDAFSPALLEWLAEYHLSRETWGRAHEAAGMLARRTEVQWQEIGFCLAGRALMGADDVEGARKAFLSALKVGAGTRYGAEAALRLGDIALRQQRPVDARTFYGKAALLSAGGDRLALRAHAYAGLGDAAKAEQDPAAAARYYMSVAVLYDDDELVPDCLARAAQAFSLAGDSHAAASALEELRARYPEHPAGPETAVPTNTVGSKEPAS
jgi:TolA-binding protein